jgi:uncharacterized protein (DUF885 family)
MSEEELQHVEGEMHTLEEKLHNILHELEAKLQNIFGSHPKIAEHVEEAKAQVSKAVPTPQPYGGAIPQETKPEDE